MIVLCTTYTFLYFIISFYVFTRVLYAFDSNILYRYVVVVIVTRALGRRGVSSGFQKIIIIYWRPTSGRAGASAQGQRGCHFLYARAHGEKC